MVLHLPSGGVLAQVGEATRGEHKAERACLSPSRHTRPARLGGIVGHSPLHGQPPDGLNQILHVFQRLLLVSERGPQVVDGSSGVVVNGSVFIWNDILVVQSHEVSVVETAFHLPDRAVGGDGRRLVFRHIDSAVLRPQVAYVAVVVGCEPAGGVGIPVDLRFDELLAFTVPDEARDTVAGLLLQAAHGVRVILVQIIEVEF